MSGRAARWCWTAWAVTAAAAATLSLTGATTPLRPVATWLFLALGPGWAFIGGGRPAADPLTRVTVALGLSIAIDITVAQAMLLTGSWSPRTGLLAVLAVSAVGLALHARRALRLRRTRKLVDSLYAQLPQLPSPTVPAGQFPSLGYRPSASRTGPSDTAGEPFAVSAGSSLEGGPFAVSAGRPTEGERPEGRIESPTTNGQRGAP